MNHELHFTETRMELTRTFDAPRPLVYEVWTDPEHAKHWAGCEGSTILSVTMDLRVGGQGRTVMEIPGAGVMTAVAIYTEVDPPRRIAYRLGWESTGEFKVPETLVTVDFEEQGDQTTVRLVHEGLMNPEMEANVTKEWRGSLERFAATLPLAVAEPAS